MPDTPLAGRHALITGGGTGIGAAAASQLSAAGSYGSAGELHPLLQQATELGAASAFYAAWRERLALLVGDVLVNNDTEVFLIDVCSDAPSAPPVNPAPGNVLVG